MIQPQRNQEYVVDTAPGATCKDCVSEQWKTDALSNALEHKSYAYWPTYTLMTLSMQPDASSGLGVVNTWTYNGNGNLAAKTEGTITYSYTYNDGHQLRITQAQVSENGTALVTDTAYDDSGLPYLITGPYVAGAAGSVTQTGIAYDALGRTRIVARQPITGTTIVGAVAAFEYFDFAGASPAAVKAYSFAVPLNYTDGAIPQSSDVRQSVVFLDGFGRAVQQRDRMGGVGSGDPTAHITQILSGYRVSQVVLYDGAGRVTAALEPFYSANGAFQDYRASPIDATSSPVHATLKAYDAQGRTICSLYRVVGANIPAIAACGSSFAEDANYARATAASYRGATVNGVSYLAVKTIPPENNISTSMQGPESFYDAAGRLRWVTDVEGNTSRLFYDLLGHATGLVREVAGGVTSPITTNASTT